MIISKCPDLPEPSLLNYTKYCEYVTRTKIHVQSISGIYFRLLENYILHGASEEAFDQITKQIDADLKDKNGIVDMVTSMRDVLQYRDMGHLEAARKIRLSCGR